MTARMMASVLIALQAFVVWTSCGLPTIPLTIVALALRLAEAEGGMIINAQVYVGEVLRCR